LKQIDARRHKRGLDQKTTDGGQGASSIESLTKSLEAARERQLVGLAFSGGGIRSATFNLGVLQGLASVGLLKFVDYLSTVSGGGYIGAWLAAWMKRRSAEHVEARLPTNGAAATDSLREPAAISGDESALAADDDAATDSPREPAAIRHLRRHTDYLAPRQGFLSADRWVLAAIYLRNFLLNQLVLLFAALIVLLLSRLLMFLYYPRVHKDYGSMLDQSGERYTLDWYWNVLLILSIMGLGMFASKNTITAVLSVGRPQKQVEVPAAAKPKKLKWLPKWLLQVLGLVADGVVILIQRGTRLVAEALNKAIGVVARGILRREKKAEVGAAVPIKSEAPFSEPKNPKWLLLHVVAPLGVAAIAFCFLASYPSPLFTFVHWVFPRITEKLWPWWPDPVLFTVVVAMLVGLSYRLATRPPDLTWHKAWADASESPEASQTPDELTYSTPVQLLCVVVGLAWGALLFGAYRLIYWMYDWDLSEPIISAQIAATALMTTIGPPLVVLTAVLAISLGVGLLRSSLGEELREWFASVCGWLLATSAAWAAVNLIALYGAPLLWWASPGVKTALASGWLLTLIAGVLAGSSQRTGAIPPKYAYSELVARFAPPIFVVGIFVLVSLLLHAAIDTPPKADLTSEGIWPYQYEPENPPSRVSMSRTGKEGAVTVERKKEYLRMANEAAARRQQYWLGMLNTKKDADVSQMNTIITDQDMDLLKNKSGITPEHLQRLERLQYHYTNWDTVSLRVELGSRLPGDSNLQLREKIIEVVQEKGRVDDNQFNFRMSFLEGIEVRKDLSERLESLQPVYIAWETDAFRAQLQSRLAGQSQLKNREEIIEKIIKFAREKGRVDENHFNFKISFLDKIEVPKDILLPLERPYREWDDEALQDELDHLFPSAHDEQTKRQILRGLKGLGPIIEMGRLVFLCKIGLCLLGCGAVLGLSARLVDVNIFSMHGMYGNRLTRAYLGASRAGAGRKPDPVTGFDPNDDLALAELEGINPKPYDGPFLIVNTAMNLVHTEELAWQERKAESFALTPLYCGSETTGYRPTGDGTASYAGGVSLGTAVTISGAAASPNMGYHSSPSVTFLLTVFNARLGAWLGNPNNKECWTDGGPRYGSLYLFKELCGWTDESSPYVYLSDGGHFENLGVYELVRRRCRYIIVSDASQDSEHSFEDLGNLIRKVRIDFGIRIEIAPDHLRLQKDPRQSRWHCAIGKIRYDDFDNRAAPGILVYIKPSLTGEEPADVLNYAASHPTFPHETTANQFYTESQFECYRALGEHIAEAVFKQSVDEVRDSEAETGPTKNERNRHPPWCRELFASLVRRWFAMPPEYEAKFVTSSHDFIQVQDAMRKDPRLWRLTLDLYPELDPNSAAEAPSSETIAERAARRAAELHILAQMLQVMENAYLSLNLEAHYAHPMNRGWMDVFHRWTSSETFRSHWLHLRSEFARDFVCFCERQMRLAVVTATAVPISSEGVLERWPRLFLEFENQWPEYRPEVEARLKDALANKTAWAIYPEISSPSADDPTAESRGLPAGVILVWPSVAARKPSDAESSPLASYDLFIWQRGAYRNTGLGRPALLKVLKEVRERFASPFRLRTRLPVFNLTGTGGKLQKAMWLTFFYHLDFVHVKEEKPSELILEQVF
jgi:hypothetical protein